MNTVLRIICTFLLIIFSLHAYSQEKIRLSGQIIDAKTQQPVPYAHVGISNSAIGTVSNTSGFYILDVPHKFRDHFLSVSSIGYQKFEVKIGDIQSDITITLQEYVTQLNEVVITKGRDTDAALELVKAAINSIPENYLNAPEMLRGFYREVSSYKNGYENIVESLTDVYKESYEKPVKGGTVRVIKARKHESKKPETSRMFFYAGTHIPHRFDFVMKRQGPLNLKKIDGYYFKITDTIQYDNKAVIKVSFQPRKEKNAKGRGKLYISSEDKAFIRGEYAYNADEIDFIEKIRELIKGDKRLQIEYITEYKKHDAEWHLKFVNYRTSFLTSGKDTLNFNAIFSVSNIKEDPVSIPYSDQLQYRDVFLENTGAYDSAFWGNYNIVVPEPEIESLFRNPERAQTPKKSAFRKFLERTRGTFSAFVTGAETLPMSINYSNNNFRINSDLKQQSYYYWGLSSSIEYELTPRLFIGFENRGAFGKNKHEAYALKIGWQEIFNIKDRPFYLVPSVIINMDMPWIAMKIPVNFQLMGKNLIENPLTYRLNREGFL